MLVSGVHWPEAASLLGDLVELLWCGIFLVLSLGLVLFFLFQEKQTNKKPFTLFLEGRSPVLMSWLYYVEGFSSSVCKLFLNLPVFRTALLPSDAPRGPDPASLQSTLFSLLLMGEGGGGRYLGILLLLKPSFCSSFCCHLHHHLHR